MTTIEELGIDRMSAEDRLMLLRSIWETLPAELKQESMADLFRPEPGETWTDNADSVPWEDVKVEI